MKRLSKAYLGLIYVFLYAPILVMIVFSFNASKSRNLWAGFTLKWYQELFHNQMVLESLGNTLIIAVIASVVSTIVGTAAAVGIYSFNRKMRNMILNVTYMPMINPEIVTGVSLMLLYVFLGMRFGFATLLCSHITFCLPYVILSVLPKLKQLDVSIYEAGLDLGCTPWWAFWKVVLPQIMPGVFSGFLMSFTYSLDDFVISYFTNGPTSQTLPITIYSMTRRKVSPEINALSTILFVAVFTLLIIINLRGINQKKKEKRSVSIEEDPA